MVPFNGWGSTASRLEPLRGGSLLFTPQSQLNLLSTLVRPKPLRLVFLRNQKGNIQALRRFKLAKFSMSWLPTPSRTS